MRLAFFKVHVSWKQGVWLSFDDLDCYEKNFKKIKPRIINNRWHNNFSNEYYRKCLFNELKRETFFNNDWGCQKFCDTSIKLLHKHAPIKMKYKRGNHEPFITKDISKAIMKRLKLRNNYLKKQNWYKQSAIQEAKKLLHIPFKKK